MSIILLIRFKYLARMFSDTDSNHSCRKLIPPEFREPYGYRDDIFHDKMKRLLGCELVAGGAAPSLQGWLYMYIHPGPLEHNYCEGTGQAPEFSAQVHIFTGSRTERFKQVGNAVLSLSGKAVAESVI